MFKIQEFSVMTGVSKRMLRYLEDQGLLIPHRGENEYRFYSSNHLEEVRWIQFWQRLGFSLNQTKVLKSQDSQKIESQLEQLLETKKEEAALQSQQLANIRSIIRKLKNNQADIHKDFSSIATWNHSEREDFLSRVSETPRIVYGKFPEVEKLMTLFQQSLSSLGFECKILENDLMKAGEAAHQIESSEILVWERKTDYTYLMAAFPEAILQIENFEVLEEKIHVTFQDAMNEVFYEDALDTVARLFQCTDIMQYLAPREIVFRVQISLTKENLRFYLFIPFQFVHSQRSHVSPQLSNLGRALKRSLIHLSEDQIREKTKYISNEHYLLTALLADAKTRNMMFCELSPDAEKVVLKDMDDLVLSIKNAWKV